MFSNPHGGEPGGAIDSEPSGAAYFVAVSRRENASDSDVNLRLLAPRTEFVAETRTSRYHFIMLDGSDWNVLVEGGEYFPVMTKARINGSTCGGASLRTGWIEVGLSMELSAGGKRIVTSPVRSIAIEGSDS
jgi:hypothetical protein